MHTRYMPLAAVLALALTATPALAASTDAASEAAQDRPAVTSQRAATQTAASTQATTTMQSTTGQQSATSTKQAAHGAYVAATTDIFQPAGLGSGRLTGTYRLAKYDVINVNVLGFPNGLGYTQSSSTINTGAGTQTLGTGDIIIGPDGNASLPYVGNIRLAGLTLAEADAQLTQALSYYLRDPQLNVAVRSYAPRKILVTGEVMTPGIQHLAIDQLDAYAAITSAGGYTKRGRSTRVQVIRVIDGTMYYRQLNMKDFVRKHDLTQNVVLQDGDIVYVPKSNAIRWNEDILPYFNAWALYKGLTD